MCCLLVNLQGPVASTPLWIHPKLRHVSVRMFVSVFENQSLGVVCVCQIPCGSPCSFHTSSSGHFATGLLSWTLNQGLQALFFEPLFKTKKKKIASVFSPRKRQHQLLHLVY